MQNGGNSYMVEVDDLVYKGASTDAYKFVQRDRFGKDLPEAIWLPKSQTTFPSREPPVIGNTYTVEIPKWLAEKKELW